MSLRSKLTPKMAEYYDEAQITKHKHLCQKLNDLIHKIYDEKGFVFSDIAYGYERVYYKKEYFLTPDGMQYLFELFQNKDIVHFHLMTDKKFIILSCSPFKI